MAPQRPRAGVDDSRSETSSTKEKQSVPAPPNASKNRRINSSHVTANISTSTKTEAPSKNPTNGTSGAAQTPATESTSPVSQPLYTFEIPFSFSQSPRHPKLDPTRKMLPSYTPHDHHADSIGCRYTGRTSQPPSSTATATLTNSPSPPPSLTHPPKSSSPTVSAATPPQPWPHAAQNVISSLSKTKRNHNPLPNPPHS
jgi:hypothetical protein